MGSVTPPTTSGVQTSLIGGLLFIPNNIGNSSGNTGTINAPYLVWQGWQGTGYYLFPSKNEETSVQVASIDQLNQFNIALAGNNLGSPFDLSGLSLPSSILGTLTIPPSSSLPSGANIPISMDPTQGFYALTSNNPSLLPHAYDQTIEGTINISCSAVDTQLIPPSLMVALFQDPSLNMPNGCPQIPFGVSIPAVPIGYISYNDTLALSFGLSDVFTVSPVINFGNLSDSSVTIAAGYKSTGVIMSFPGLIYANLSAGIAGASLTLDSEGVQVSGTGTTATVQVVSAINNSVPISYTTGCTLGELGLIVGGNLSGQLFGCQTDSSVSITSYPTDPSTVTGQGAYGSATNPISTGDWLTSIGINWYGVGYYTMPRGAPLYFNTGQELVTGAVESGYTATVNSDSQGSSATAPVQPNSDGTLTWYGPGYYNVTNQQANGGNPTGIYYVSNQEFITIYDENVQGQ